MPLRRCAFDLGIVYGICARWPLYIVRNPMLEFVLAVSDVGSSAWIPRIMVLLLKSKLNGLVFEEHACPVVDIAGSDEADKV